MKKRRKGERLRLYLDKTFYITFVFGRKIDPMTQLLGICNAILIIEIDMIVTNLFCFENRATNKSVNLTSLNFLCDRLCLLCFTFDLIKNVICKTKQKKAKYSMDIY